MTVVTGHYCIVYTGLLFHQKPLETIEKKQQKHLEIFMSWHQPLLHCYPYHELMPPQSNQSNFDEMHGVKGCPTRYWILKEILPSTLKQLKIQVGELRIRKLSPLFKVYGLLDKVSYTIDN